jgi:Ala-tRNA(Pro) deacylase
MPILGMLKEFLESNDIQYSVHSHPQAFTAQEIAALQHVKGRLLAKVVIVRAGGALRMLVLPADHKVDFGKLNTALSTADAALASEADFEAVFPGSELGAMPPFGNLYGLPVYADRSMERHAEIVFNAGTHTQTVRVRFSDFVSLAKPIMADFAVHL